MTVTTTASRLDRAAEATVGAATQGDRQQEHGTPSNDVHRA